MKKFEDNIKNKLFDLELTADDNLWKSIEQKLPPAKASAPSSHWLQVPGILAVTLAIIMLLQNGDSPSKDDQLLSSDHPIENSAGMLPAAQKQTTLPADKNNIEKLESKNNISTTESKKQNSINKAQPDHKNKKQILSVDIVDKKEKSQSEVLVHKKSNTVSPLKKSENEKTIALVPGKGWKNIDWQVPTRVVEKVAVKKAPEVIVPDEKVKSAWSLFAEANPMFLYRQVKPNTNDEINIIDLEEQNPLSLDRSGYQLRLGSQYQLNQRWAVKAGLNYQYKRNKLTYQYETAPDSFNITSSDQSFTFKPIASIETGTIDRSTHMYGFMAGIAYRRGSIVFQNYNLELQGLHNGSEMRYFLAFDINLEKPFNDYWSAYAGPALTWQINNPAFNDQPYSLQTYSIGLRFGLKYNIHFNKK